MAGKKTHSLIKTSMESLKRTKIFKDFVEKPMFVS